MKKFVSLILGLLIVMSTLVNFVSAEDNETEEVTDEINATEIYCKDSDGGKDYYVKGKLKSSLYPGKVFEDYCMTATTSTAANLGEYYCEDNGNFRLITYKCPNGCEDGACVKEDKCSSDSDCELIFSHCSCSYECVKKSDGPRVDCTRICPAIGLPEVECACINGECIKSQQTCTKVCKYVGTRSEGWYDSCTGELIEYDKCGTQTCVGEGQKIKWDDYTSECCGGLNKISDSSGFSDDCNAMIMSNGYVCAKCGDGNCGLGESKCNCAEDCLPSEIYAYLNQKFELREKQSAKVVDYKNMKIRLNDIITECVVYSTQSTTSAGGSSGGGGGVGCRLIGVRVQVEMPSECETSTSNEAESCTSTGTDFVLKRGESRNVFDAEISLLGLSDNSAVFIVKKNIPQEDYVDVYIEPTIGEITYGEYAKYEVTVVDKHPRPTCGIGVECPVPPYTYQIVVGNLPFLKEYPKRVTLDAGEKKSFTLVVKPYQLIVEEAVAIEESPTQVRAVEGVAKAVIAKEQVKKISKVKAVPITGGAVTSTQVIEEAVEDIPEEEVSVEVLKPYYMKEYKFDVRATLSGNPKVQDIAYAILRIKPTKPITPPPFPKEEVEIKLYRGWNLISLPGKLVNFESNGLTRKLLGFVYLKDEQRYVAIKEAQSILGDEFREYLATNAFWVYSYTDYTLRVNIDKEISFGNINLNPKWNLVPITEDMVGGYLSDLKGDCEFEKLYKWDAQTQSWGKLTESYVFKSGEVNKGIIIKAEDYCTMGGVTITTVTPPAMPEE